MMGRLLSIGILIFGVSTAASPSCDEGAQVIVRGTRCHRYTKCENGQWFLQQCTIGKIFNPKTQRCQSITEQKCLDRAKKCEEGNTYSHPDSNRFYYQCLHGHISTRYCGVGEVFDHQTESCQINTVTLNKEYRTISGSDFVSRTKRNTNELCIENSKHRDGKSCRDYIECINGVEVKKTCPDCMNYDEVSKSCRFNVFLPCGPNSVMPTPQPSPATSSEPSPSPSPGTPTEPSPSPSPRTSTEPSPSPSPRTSTEPSPSPSPRTSTEPSSPSPRTSTEPSPSPSPRTSTEPSPSPSSRTSTEPSPSPSPRTSTEPPSSITEQSQSTPLKTSTTTISSSTSDSSTKETTTPVSPTTVSCTEGERIPVKDPDCKEYEECVNGVFVKKRCFWFFEYDIKTNKCLFDWWNKVHCYK